MLSSLLPKLTKHWAHPLLQRLTWFCEQHSIKEDVLHILQTPSWFSQQKAKDSVVKGAERLIMNCPTNYFCVWRQRPAGAIPNFATEKEQKRNFLDFNDVTLVVVDIKSERFVKSTCLQQDLFDMTMVTIMFDTKTSESESFIDRSIEGIINIMMEFHHF